MNVVFISPHFPEYYHNFCSRLKDRGVNVLGVGDCPYDMISDETKNSLTEYYYVGSLENYDEVYRACAYFSSQYGKIDWIESENEYWLELEATLRRDFNVTTGPQIQDMRWVKYKSAMKEVYKSAGLKVADYIKLDTLDEALEFTKKNGYPVIVKPDNGVGATHTYKLKNDEELKDFYNHKQDYIDYILEDFVPGDVVTFEGVTDKDKNILFSTSHFMDTSIMDTVNEASDIYFHSEPVEGKPIYEIGEKVVKAFDTKSRFFHFEFIKLSEDKPGLGRKGDLVPLEVNMRAPGAFIPDMMNYAYDVDTYTIWADMMIYNTCFYEIERKYYVGYVGRRLGIDYELYWKYKEDSVKEIAQRYSNKEAICDPISTALKEIIKDEAGRISIAQFINDQSAISSKVSERLKERISYIPVEITQFSITNLDWSDEYESAIRETARIAQEIERAKNEAEVAAQQAQKKVKQAEAEAQAAEFNKKAMIAKAEGKAAYKNLKVAQNLSLMQAQWKHEEEMARLEKWDGVQVSSQSIYVPNTYDLKSGK